MKKDVFKSFSEYCGTKPLTKPSTKHHEFKRFVRHNNHGSLAQFACSYAKIRTFHGFEIFIGSVRQNELILMYSNRP